jgi:predicted Holliday junction resolvase-like endonuclease
MSIVIESIAYHRNGICGAPFHVILFDDSSEGKMLGIVFPEKYHVAVLQREKLAADNITFGQNSWRGDVYEPRLRRAIEAHQQEEEGDDPKRA